jgi:hypothetical protein
MGPTPIAIPFAFPWFKAPSIAFWSLPQCVQRLWEYLKNITHGGATTFKMRDWELAEALGVGRRCVQKALRLAELHGLIRRYRDYGHNGGRVIEIMINLAAPKPRAKPRPKAKVPTATQSSPEQIAAAKAQDEAQAQQAQAREAKLRTAWEQLTEPQREAIRAKVKAENPALARWDNVIENLCLGALEAQDGAPVGTTGNGAGP